MEKFLVTKDKESKEKLLNLGFQMINETHDGFSVFVNCATLKFSKTEVPHVAYTNNLLF